MFHGLFRAVQSPDVSDKVLRRLWNDHQTQQDFSILRVSTNQFSDLNVYPFPCVSPLS